MTPQHMRLIVFTLLFILSFSQVSFAETCAEILAGKTFATDGFEILKVPEPLTAAEAASLHKKLVFYLEMNAAEQTNTFLFLSAPHWIRPSVLPVEILSSVNPPHCARFPKCENLKLGFSIHSNTSMKK